MKILDKIQPSLKGSLPKYQYWVSSDEEVLGLVCINSINKGALNSTIYRYSIREDLLDDLGTSDFRAGDLSISPKYVCLCKGFWTRIEKDHWHEILNKELIRKIK